MAKFGSARSDERGKLSGGRAGDQTGREVMVQNAYVHSKGWVILRAKDVNFANGLAFCMAIACANEHIGYDQSNRLGAYINGITTNIDTETDCSGLVRACCKQCGHDVPNFTTANESQVLLATGLFEKVAFTNLDSLYTGDILITKTTGHTGIITEGKPRQNTYDLAEPVLKKGSKGSEVKKLQTQLNYFCNAGLVVDGSFGNATRNAIISVQKAFNIAQDGCYGKQTKGCFEWACAMQGLVAV